MLNELCVLDIDTVDNKLKQSPLVNLQLLMYSCVIC